jgi:hypothetical protein
MCVIFPVLWMEAFFLNDSLIIFLFTLLLLFHFAHCKNSRSLHEHSNRSMDLSLAQLSHLRSYQLETTMAAHADTHEIVVPEDLVRYEDTPLVNKHPIHPIVHRKVRPRGDSHCGDHLYGAVLMGFLLSALAPTTHFRPVCSTYRQPHISKYLLTSCYLHKPIQHTYPNTS